MRTTPITNLSTVNRTLRGTLLVALLSLSPGLAAQPALRESFQPLPVGAVTPEGWIKTQMTKDTTTGMAGHFLTRDKSRPSRRNWRERFRA